MINRIKQWNFKNFKINDKSIINFSREEATASETC